MGEGKAHSEENSSIRRRDPGPAHNSVRPGKGWKAAGLDPALTRPTGYATIIEAPEGPRVAELGLAPVYDALAAVSGALAAAVDAPLHPPYRGFRDVERRLAGSVRGARLLPGGLPSMQRLSALGLSIRWALWQSGTLPLETHPSTACRILSCSRAALSEAIRAPVDVVDALLAAAAAYCFLTGESILYAGEDGLIVLPSSKCWEKIKAD